MPVTEKTITMDFTVIIPSRNRPVLLRKAIDSVLMQTHSSVEILVVNDGSDGENELAYARLAEELSGKVRFLNLEKAKNGHGQSGSINRGAEVAQGRFLCFLDDDDYWTDPNHLKRAFQSLENAKAEIYFANQVAVQGNTPIPGPLWLDSLKDKFPPDTSPDADEAYAVTIQNLMACPGFGHLNTTITSKSLFSRIAGMDENIRYECDLDFYLRIIDAADGIRYFPGVVSLHNAPDPSKALNMSTTVTFLQKMQFRLMVWEKALLFSHSQDIRRHAMRHKMHTLKKITHSLAQANQYRTAFHYSRQALACGFSFKWAAHTLWMAMRAAASIFSRGTSV